MRIYIKLLDKSVIKRTKMEASCIMIIDGEDQPCATYMVMRCLPVLHFCC